MLYFIYEEARKRLVVFSRRKVKVMQLSVNDSSWTELLSLRARPAAESGQILRCSPGPLALLRLMKSFRGSVLRYMRATAPERTVSTPELLRTATCAQITTSIGG